MTYRSARSANPNAIRRRRRIESLEPRHLLAAAPFGTNVLQPVDVTRDGMVTPGDILEVINALAAERTTGNDAVSPSVPGDFTDVNADGFRTPQDILSVIESLAEKKPVIAARLPVDSAPDGRTDLGLDLLTNDYSIELNVSAGDLDGEAITMRVGDDGDFVDITNQFDGNAASLTEADVDAVLGGPLPDGDHQITVKIGDSGSEINFVLSVDRASPSSDPDLSGITLLGPQSINFMLSETIDESKIDLSTVEVVDLAGNDLAILPESFSYQNGDSSIEFQFAQPFAEGAYQIKLNQSHITDAGGNALGDGVATQGFDIVDADAIWSNPEGGLWDRASNWESGEVPGPGAKVLIVTNPGESVFTGTRNEIDVEKVTLYGGLQVSPLGILQTSQLRVKTGTFSVRGRVVGAEISEVPRSADEPSSEPGISLEAGTLDAVTLNADARLVDKSISSSFRVTVENGLTVNKILTLAGTSTRGATLDFRGEQTLDGNGQVFFSTENADENGPAKNVLSYLGNDIDVPELLTIAEGFTLSGSVTVIGGVRGNEDYINFQGRAVGVEGGLFTMSGLTGEIDVEGPASSIQFTNLQTDLTINGSEGTVVELDDVLLDNVTLNIDSIIQPNSRFINGVTAENGLTVNADLIIAGTSSIDAKLSFRHAQTLDGSGRILFSQRNVDEDDRPAKNSFCFEITETESKDSLTIVGGLIVPELGEC